MEKREVLFEKLYQSNYNKVIRLCKGYADGDATLAKDWTQEVFIKVWQHMESFRNEATVSTWVYRITVNTCLLQLRVKKKKYQIFNNLEEMEALQGGEIPESLQEKKLMHLHKCIQRLPETNKTIILLELEGVPQKEIAEITGMSHEAVRGRIHRIKDNLTKCIKNDHV